jgi:hypothetical protein
MSPPNKSQPPQSRPPKTRPTNQSSFRPPSLDSERISHLNQTADSQGNNSHNVRIASNQVRRVCADYNTDNVADQNSRDRSVIHEFPPNNDCSNVVNQ